MGATITVALVIGNIATIANVGDARTYLFNKSSGLRQVTDDHSVVWERVKSGAITKAQIQEQTDRNVITRAIDNTSVLTAKDVDVFRETLVPGDIMLQCSDGIWEMISDETIEGELRATTVLEDACSAMVVKANAAGGDDNATVLLVALG
jgi:protein phosphatase